MRRTAQAFESLVCKHLPTSAHPVVVDYGCGDMPYRPLFESRGCKYLGADLVENTAAELALTQQGKLPLLDCSVDLVISSQVLEHVIDVNSYLEECARVLKPGGALLLSTHGMWIYHPHPTDVRRWTRWGLRHEIEQAAFSVVDTRSCIGPLAYTTQLRLLLLKGALRSLGSIGSGIVAPLSLLCQGMMWLEDRITPRWVLEDNASVYVMAALKSGRALGPRPL